MAIIARELESATYVGMGLWYLGGNLISSGDLTRAAEVYDESIRTLPPQQQGALHIARYFQGVLMWRRFGGECGLPQVHDALAYFRETGFNLGVITVLLWLGERALSRQDVPHAGQYLRECLSVAYRHGAWFMFVKCVNSLAIAEAIAGQPARAITLMSAAQRMNASAISTDQQEQLVAARKQLDPRELAAAIAAGHAMSYDQALAFALQGNDADESSKG